LQLEVNRSVQLGFQSGEESGKEFIAEIMDDTSTIGWYDFETKYEQSLIESPTNIAGRRFNSWSAVNGNSEDGGGCERRMKTTIPPNLLNVPRRSVVLE